MIYSFGRNGLEEMLGLGEAAPETTSTPTPIKGLPSVGGVSASSNIAVALPAGRLAARRRCCRLGSATEALEVGWTAPAEAYRLRYRPLGTKPWSKLLEREGGCLGRSGLRLPADDLRLGPQPYEMDLVDAKLSEGKTTPESRATSPDTLAPAARSPAEHRAPAIGGPPQQGQSVTVSPEPGPTARPRPATSGCAAKATAKRAAKKNSARNANRSKAPPPPPTAPRRPTHATRCGSPCAPPTPPAGASPSRGPKWCSGAAKKRSAGAGKPLGSHPHRRGRAGQDPDRAPRRLGRRSRAYSYKWLRCGPTPARAAARLRRDPGRAGQTYTLGSEDVGMWIEVQETPPTAAAGTSPPRKPSKRSPPKRRSTRSHRRSPARSSRARR